MGRKKIQNKNVPISVSLPVEQVQYIENHPKFNFSKFVQIHFSDYILVANEVERIQKEVENDEKTTD